MSRLWVRILATLLAIILIASTLFMLYTSTNTDDFISTAIKNGIKRNQDLSYELLNNSEEIVVYTVGTSAYLPSRRAQSCTAVFVNGLFFLFDIGVGAISEMERIHLPLEHVDAVFISHYQSDHYAELPYLINRSWQLGRIEPLDVFGPSGINDIIEASDKLLAIDMTRRESLHGSAIYNQNFIKTEPHAISMNEGGSQLIYNQNDIKVTAFDVSLDQISPSLGYMISYKDKKIVLSGHTNKNTNVIAHAKEADLLIHDAMLVDFMHQLGDLNNELGIEREAGILKNLTAYHATPSMAAEVANEANVQELVLSHLAPVPDRKVLARQYTMGLNRIFKGPIHLADDGDKFTVN